MVMNQSGSSSEESSAEEAGSTRVVTGVAEAEGAEDAVVSVMTLLDSVMDAMEVAREVTRAESIEVG